MAWREATADEAAALAPAAAAPEPAAPAWREASPEEADAIAPSGFGAIIGGAGRFGARAVEAVGRAKENIETAAAQGEAADAAAALSEIGRLNLGLPRRADDGPLSPRSVDFVQRYLSGTAQQRAAFQADLQGRAARTAPSATPAPTAAEMWSPEWFGDLVGGVAPYIVTGLAGGPAGIAASAYAAYMDTLGGIYSDQVRGGRTPAQAATAASTPAAISAAAMAAFPGATGVGERIAAKLTPETAGALRAKLMTAGGQLAGAEAVMEGQNTATNIATGQPAFANAGETAAAGAVLAVPGAVMASPHVAARAIPDRRVPTPLEAQKVDMPATGRAAEAEATAADFTVTPEGVATPAGGPQRPFREATPQEVAAMGKAPPAATAEARTAVFDADAPDTQIGWLDAATGRVLPLDEPNVSRDAKAVPPKEISPLPTAEAVDKAAAETNTAPTEAQKAAGNYAKGTVKIQGMDVAIENPRGSERRGVGADGQPWSVTMPVHYGYVKGTKGADGDAVDVFVGPRPEARHVFVVDQIDADTGKFDEHKAMLGFEKPGDAMLAYRAAFSDGKDRIGAITAMPVATFRRALNVGLPERALAERPPAGGDVLYRKPPPPFVVDEHLPKFLGYVKNTKDSLLPEAVAKHLGVTPAQARAVISAAMSGTDSGLRMGPKGPARIPQRTAPMDARAFIASRGGLDLAHARAEGIDNEYFPGLGTLVRRKGGMSLDGAAELLTEAGYLKPTDIGNGADTAAAFDALTRSGQQARVYRGEDAAAVAERAGARDDLETMQRVADAWHEAGASEPLTSADVNAIAALAAEGYSIEDATVLYSERLAIQQSDANAESAREPEYEVPVDLVEEAGQGGARPAAAAGAAGEVPPRAPAARASAEGEGRGRPEEDALDALGEKFAAPRRPITGGPDLFGAPPKATTTAHPADAMRDRFSAEHALAPTLYVQVGQKRYQIADYEEASKLALQAQRRTEMPEGGWGSLPIMDGAGIQVANVAPNGRVFAGTSRDWSPATKLLYDSSAPGGTLDQTSVGRMRDARPTVEETAAGPSVPLAGMERGTAGVGGSERQRAQRGADQAAPVNKPKTEQKPADEGLFDTGSRKQGSLFAAPRPFFSALTRAVETAKQPTATGAQWAGILKNLPGLKREELDWSGVDEWLDGRKDQPVTRDELADYLRQNEVKVEEVALGGDAAPMEWHQDGPRRWRADTDKRRWIIVEGRGVAGERFVVNNGSNELHRFPTLDAAKAYAQDGGGRPKEPTKFHSQQLPGGENYRELLLTLSLRRTDEPSYEIVDKSSGEVVDSGLTKADADATVAGSDKYEARVGSGAVRHLEDTVGGNAPGTFTGGHYDTPNVLAHIRFNDRTDSDGKKVLFVEEIQSDWHQKGRRTGYRTSDAEQPNYATWAERRGMTRAEIDRTWNSDDPRFREWRADAESAGAQNSANAVRVPDAPFKATEAWAGLAFKRMVRWAAEHGYERIAWTPGEIQNERYDLSARLDAVAYRKNADGTFDISTSQGGEWQSDPRMTGKRPDELPDIVGKDMADKILGAAEKKPEGEFRGLDLKVGGEGMRGFYDKILPGIANKLGKKFVAKVGETKIDARDADTEYHRNAFTGGTIRRGRGAWILTSADGNGSMPFATRAEAEKFLRGPAKDIAVHSLDITDAMRESVLQGQPLFAAARGDDRRSAAAILPELQQRLKDVGIDDRVTVRLTRKIEAVINGKAQAMDGRFVDRLIEVSMGAPDKLGILDHEIIHAIRAMGLFTVPEWKALERMAATAERMADIRKRYPNLTPGERLEEAVADHFADWVKGGKATKRSADLFSRLRDLFTKLRNLFIGAGWRTGDDVMAAIHGGEIGKRYISPDAGRADERFAAAWHGSPHDFDQFDSSKIGTGEGNQAFGHGLYFTDSKAIANYYKAMRSKDGPRGVVLYEGREIADSGRPLMGAGDLDKNVPDEIKLAASHLASNRGLASEAMESLRRKEMDFRENKDLRASPFQAQVADKMVEAYGKARAAIAGGRVKWDEKPTGRLYAVDLKPKEEDYLRWDMPLSDQSEKVKAAVAEIPENVWEWIGDQLDSQGKNAIEPHDPDYNGSHLYQALTRAAGEDVLPGMTSDGSNSKADASQYLRDLGIPGIKYPAGTLAGTKSEAFNYVIFDDKDVEVTDKFAVPRVRGQALFDPDKTMGELLADTSRPLVARLRDTVDPKTLGATGDRIRYLLQDNFLPVLRAQQAIETVIGRPLREGEDAYLGQELQSGRIGERLDEINTEHVQPLLVAMQEAKVTPAELDAFLYARHAPERNAQIAKINPKIPHGGSGLSDAEAAGIVAGARKAGKLHDLESLGRRVDAMQAQALKLRVDAGLLTAKEAQQWRDQYQHYVPLRGDPGLPQQFAGTRPRHGSGINVKGRESQRAFGRTTPASDIVAHAILQAQEAVVRAETNKVGQELLELAKAMPDKRFWQIDKVATKPVLNKATGQVEYRPQNRILAEDADFTITTKVDGVEHRITLNRKNPAARLFAEAARNTDIQSVGLVVQTWGKINRFQSAVITRFAPDFIVRNMARDLQEATINLAGKEVDGLVKDTLRDYLPALKAATQAEFGKGSGPWAKWYREFARAGGKVSFNVIDDINGLRKQLLRDYTDAKRGPSLRKGARLFFRTVERVNGGIESAIRLAAYKNLRERGWSEAKAASVAKNLTVNFNRHGKYGPVLNSMYLFYNASIQGSVTVLKALRTSKRVQGIALAGIGVGAALDILNSMISPPGPDGESAYDKLDPYVRNHNWILMHPDGTYASLPMPFGYAMFPAIGRTVSAIARGKPATNAGAELLQSIADGWNPLGNAVAWWQFLFPSAAQTVIQAGTNTDYRGNPIVPEQDVHARQKPQSELSYSTTSPFWRVVASGLNRVTGGDAITPGLVDVSPALLSWAWGQATGGAGRFIDQVTSFVPKLLDPNAKVTWNDVPIARVLVGQPSPAYDRNAFYSRAGDIDTLQDRRDAYAKNGDTKAVEGLTRGHPELALRSMATKSQGQLQDIAAKRIAAKKARDAGTMTRGQYDAAIRAMNTTADDIVTRFNAAYINATKPSKGGKSNDGEAR